MAITCMIQRKRYEHGFPVYGEGTLYVICDYCKNEFDTKVDAEWQIVYPEGWKKKDIQRPSHEGTSIKDGTNIFCPKCG